METFFTLIVVYILVILFTFTFSMCAVKLKHGKVHPNDVFSFGVMALLWPYLAFVIAESMGRWVGRKWRNR